MKQKYSKMVQKQREFFESRETMDVNFRKLALTSLKSNLNKYDEKLYQALELDLNKNNKEALLTEIGQVHDELDLAIKKVKKWSSFEKVKTNYTTFGTKAGSIAFPRGIAFIIAPFNYPINLSLIPLIASIAAGNTSIVKFSEFTPNVNKILTKIFKESFKPEHVSVIRDEELNSFDEIYEEGIDFMFFTGSTQVGAIIRQQCAKYNVPNVLELGGKSPAIIGRSAGNKKNFVERIVWGKLLNAGQTCVAPDYFLTHQSITINLIEELKREIAIQYPNTLEKNNLPKMINKAAFDRVNKLIAKYKDQVVYGGQSVEETLIIEPTIILLKDAEELKNIPEVFGPIFFIASYKDITDAIYLTKEIDSTPLAAYLFSTNKEKMGMFVNGIDSVNMAINNMVIQISNPKLRFGGLKSSGVGGYHGKFGFDAFSYRKNVVNQKLGMNLPFMYINKGTGFFQTRKALNKLKKIL